MSIFKHKQTSYGNCGEIAKSFSKGKKYRYIKEDDTLPKGALLTAVYPRYDSFFKETKYVFEWDTNTVEIGYYGLDCLAEIK